MHSASCAAQKHVLESRCEAPNWTKYQSTSPEHRVEESGDKSESVAYPAWAPLGIKRPPVGERKGGKWGGNREATPLPCYEVRELNLKLRSICAGAHNVFSFKHFLLAAERRLIYSQSVFHSSFSPSLPYPILKDCSGEYTGSIKLFWPEIPLLINHLQGLLISSQSKGAHSGVCCWAGQRLL